MNELYVQMMRQQNLSDNAECVFFEKLQNTQRQKRTKPAFRTAIILACVLLLIPITVMAVENIFGLVVVEETGKVVINEKPGIGLDIRFEDIKSHPIKAFSKHLRTIEGVRTVYYDSWDTAEEDLGIDLLSNSLIDDEKTAAFACFSEKGMPYRKMCEGVYLGSDDQLYRAQISAAYKRENVVFVVKAELTAEHPSMSEERLREYHGIRIAYYEEYKPAVTTQQYVTPNGIPVTICKIDIGKSPEYDAYFAVNDTSYTVSIVGWEGVVDDAKLHTLLCEILDGFII